METILDQDLIPKIEEVIKPAKKIQMPNIDKKKYYWNKCNPYNYFKCFLHRGKYI
jgi:hypothetical protein